MKQLNLLIAFLLLITLVKAQTPQGFNYSAVARDATGKPLANRNVSVQLSILKTSPTGALQYAENHLVNTDGYGLFNLVVGNGIVQSGSMNNIQWGSDNHYLKVAIDANGGNSFANMGTTQLMSVPYALHAKTADSVVGGGTGNGGFTHYIGEVFGGGVIFHLWKDAQGTEHGLIVDLVALSGQIWSNISTSIFPSAQSSWDGFSNSNSIVTQAGHTNSAAALCLNSTNGGFNDWYLPSLLEFQLLRGSIYIVNFTLSQVSGATLLGSTCPSFLTYVTCDNELIYWTSSEIDANSASIIELSESLIFPAASSLKNELYGVRAIRKF